MTKYIKANVSLSEGRQYGKPPHIGWWLCETNWWRWWNGCEWSYGLRSNATPMKIMRFSITPADATDIQWFGDWPEDSAVARINPETGECTGSGPCPYELEAARRKRRADAMLKARKQA